MAKKRIFISFDYEHDKNYRYLLSALAANSGNDLEFIDVTPSEIQSNDVSKIKAVLTTKIRNATLTLVVVGKHANSYHPDREKIGERNWQWWEIKKSHEEGKGFIGVKIERSNDAPEPLLNKGAKWAHSFNVEAIIEAINNA
jgi:hypothetical protein